MQQGLANACNMLPRWALSTKLLHFQTGAKHAHEDKLRRTKDLLRNRNVTLGKFLTRQDEVLACHPHTRQVYIHLAKDAGNKTNITQQRCNSSGQVS